MADQKVPLFKGDLGGSITQVLGKVMADQKVPLFKGDLGGSITQVLGEVMEKIIIRIEE